MTSRKLSIKQDVDLDDGNRRRSEVSASIRKEKRSERMTKRRLCDDGIIADSSISENLISGDTDTSEYGDSSTISASSGGRPVISTVTGRYPVVGGGAHIFSGMSGASDEIDSEALLSDIRNDIYLGISNKDYNVILRGVRKARKTLSLSKKINPALLSSMINAGLIPLIVSSLEYDNQPEIQLEAAWALTNVASGTSTEIQAVLDANALPQFVRLLSSSTSEDVKGQCAWAIGNIAGESAYHRDLVLGANALPWLLKFLQCKVKVSNVRNVTWSISNIFSWKPPPSIDNAKLALPTLARLVHIQDKDTVADACWAIVKIGEGHQNINSYILESGVVPRLVELLKTGDPDVQAPAVRAIGGVATGNDSQTQIVVNLGTVPVLVSMASHETVAIRKDALWALSNISAGTHEQIESVLESNGITRMVGIFEDGAQWDILKEATWVIYNCISGGTEEQILRVAMQGAIKALNYVLPAPEVRMVELALLAFESILKAAKNRGLRTGQPVLSNVTEVFYNFDIVQAIEQLQLHPEEKIYKLSNNLLINYFDAEVDTEADTTIAPEVTPNQFTFGADNMNNTNFYFK